MDGAELQPLVEDLTGNIDDLEESLAPLLKTALSQSTSKLPLLDKAKLYVLATYAIESTLFSSLRLNGVDAKSHPVFQELARVKEYFAKIKLAETGPPSRTAVLNKDAANRFIKHGLAGNAQYDKERAERMAQEKAGAKRKLEEMGTGTHTKFEDSAKRAKTAEGASPSQRIPKSSKDVLDSLVGSSPTDQPKSKKSRKKSQRKLEERRAAEMK
jgi:exosome complex protein LRP1